MMFGEKAAELCSAASLLLGWAPGEFWRATPGELALALGGPDKGTASVDHDLLAVLRNQFPDD
jgi:hypothetical protein